LLKAEYLLSLVVVALKKQVHEEFLRLTVDDSPEHHRLVAICLPEWG
jgi:hypothetical protein